VFVINSHNFGPSDPDAIAYLAAVATADGASVPMKVQMAVNSFIVGCKSDGIWSAIKAACFLAGPTTLAGALVPIVGSAPTNVNFTSGDYNSVTGLVGNGSNKYLNSNRAANADPQNNHHLSVWISSNSGTGVFVSQISNASPVAHSGVNAATAVNWPFRSRLRDFTVAARGTRGTTTATGLLGQSRSSASAFTSRVQGSNESITSSSTAAGSETFGVFARRRSDTGTIDAYTSSRLAWYSIGESLNLAQLDARLATYMAEIA
jgi:hypothetical protein